MATPDEPSIFAQGMSLIVRSVRLRPIGYLLAISGAVLYGLASVGFTVVLGWVTDDILNPGFSNAAETGGIGLSTRLILLGMGAFVLIGSCRAAGAMARRWFLSWAEFSTQKIWRMQLLDHYLNVQMEFHDRTPAGQLLAHADADVERSTRMLKPLAFAVGTMVMAVTALIALLQVSVWLALVAVVLFPLLNIINRAYTSRVSSLVIVERELVGEVSALTHESLDGALVVKTLGREEDEVARLDEAAARLEAVRIKIGRLRGTFEPMIDGLPNLGVVALLLLGAWLVGNGEVTTGGVLRAVALFTILSVPLRILGFFLQEIPSSVAALARVDSVLAEPVEDRESAVRSLPDGPLNLAFEDVTFRFPEPPPAGDDRAAGATSVEPAESVSPTVLDQLSFTVAAGESVAIVGSTGSGKSTVGHLIAELIQPESGIIRVAETDISTVARADIEAARAIVFQEAFLFASTLRDNVVLGENFTDDQIANALNLAQASDFVAATDHGLDTVVGERGVTLSGGQRQRIALARALIRRPRLLVLDDATSAVDPTIEAKILAGLRRDLRTTLVVVAYRLATITLADRVLYLADGQMAGMGTHHELMAIPGYAALISAYEDAAESVRAEPAGAESIGGGPQAAG